jgi:hypothetical protein
MIESDIKVDFDDIHCTNSFSGSFGGIDTSDLFSDINIRIEDGLLAPLSPLTTTSTSKSNVPLWSTTSNSYGYTSRDVSLMEDITGATGLMVNPINQMPVGRQPKEKLSQITVSTNQHLGNVQQQNRGKSDPQKLSIFEIEHKLKSSFFFRPIYSTFSPHLKIRPRI